MLDIELLGEILLLGRIFFLTFIPFLCFFPRLNLVLKSGEPPIELLQSKGSLLFDFPLWVLNSETTDFPQFVKSDGDFKAFDLELLLLTLFILNYLLLLSFLFSSILSAEDVSDVVVGQLSF